VGLLEQPAFSLEEGDGSINRISNNHPSNSILNLAYLFRSSRMGLICRRVTISILHQQVRWRSARERTSIFLRPILIAKLWVCTSGVPDAIETNKYK
jgi:hypothetical protein